MSNEAGVLQLGRFGDYIGRVWHHPASLTIFGTVCSIAVSLTIHFLLFRGMDGDSFQRAMLAAVILPVLVCAPVFYFLSIKFRELSTLNQQHAEAVAYDSLTSCLNGTLFSAMVDVHPTLTGSRRGRRQGALLVVDVDNMRTLNERAGRRAGNDALRIVAGIIRASVRSGDLVGRIGGGEFGIFLPGASKNNALHVAERIRHTVAEAQFSAAGSNWQLSISTGAVLFETEIDFDGLMRAADLQLKVAKKMGRNRIAHTLLQPGSSTPRPKLH